MRKHTTDQYCIIHETQSCEIIGCAIFDTYEEAAKHRVLENTKVVTLYDALDKIKEFIFEQGYDSGKTFLQ
jgi:hypothetical protein